MTRVKRDSKNSDDMAFLESLRPELGGCFRMTVDIVYIGDWISEKVVLELTLKKEVFVWGGVERINITSLVDLLWVTTALSYTLVKLMVTWTNKSAVIKFCVSQKNNQNFICDCMEFIDLKDFVL